MPQYISTSTIVYIVYSQARLGQHMNSNIAQQAILVYEYSYISQARLTSRNDRTHIMYITRVLVLVLVHYTCYTLRAHSSQTHIALLSILRHAGMLGRWDAGTLGLLSTFDFRLSTFDIRRCRQGTYRTYRTRCAQTFYIYYILNTIPGNRKYQYDINILILIVLPVPGSCQLLV